MSHFQQFFWAPETKPACQEIVIFHPSHIDQWMRVLVFPKQLLDEGTGSSQDHLVCFHLLTILAGQSHISKVIVISQVSKSAFDVLMEVVPPEAKLFQHFCAAELVE